MLVVIIEVRSTTEATGPTRVRRTSMCLKGVSEWVNVIDWLIVFQWFPVPPWKGTQQSWVRKLMPSNFCCFFFPLRIGGMKVSPSSSSVKNFNLEGPITSRGWRMGRSPGGVIPCRVLIVGIGGMHQIPWVLVPFSEQHRRYIYLECPEIWRSAYVC